MKRARRTRRRYPPPSSKPVLAKGEHEEALGFLAKLVENGQEKAIGKMGELLTRYRSLQVVYMDSCVKCGECTDSSHYCLGTGEPKNMPVGRQDLMRSVYRRYFTFAGKYAPWLVGAQDLTEEVLDDWDSYDHQCSQCRRCSVYCPFGIDTAEVSMAIRAICKAQFTKVLPAYGFKKAEKDLDPHSLLGCTAHDVAGAMRREGMQATLTSLFPIGAMTASARATMPNAKALKSRAASCPLRC